MKLHQLLEQEAGELKRLLGGKARAMANQGGGGAGDEASTRATLSQLKTDVASRRLHEASTSASEVCGRISVSRKRKYLEHHQQKKRRLLLEVGDIHPWSDLPSVVSHYLPIKLVAAWTLRCLRRCLELA